MHRKEREEEEKKTILFFVYRVCISGVHHCSLGPIRLLTALQCDLAQLGSPNRAGCFLEHMSNDLFWMGHYLGVMDFIINVLPIGLKQKILQIAKIYHYTNI